MGGPGARKSDLMQKGIDRCNLQYGREPDKARACKQYVMNCVVHAGEDYVDEFKLCSSKGTCLKIKDENQCTDTAIFLSGMIDRYGPFGKIMLKKKGMDQPQRQAQPIDLEKYFPDDHKRNKMLDMLGRKKIESLLYYFVNPTIFPQPTEEIVPGELVFEDVEYVGSLADNFEADKKYIPEMVRILASYCVRPFCPPSENEIVESMVCVGRLDAGSVEYNIYVTASHVIDRRTLPDYYILYDGGGLSGNVSLVAIPSSRDQRYKRPLQLADGYSTERFFFTVDGSGIIRIGSDPRYTDRYSSGDDGMTGYSGARSGPGEIMLFRGLNTPNDSGGAVVNREGKLVGIILGGDRKLTVAAYANMEALSKAIESFKDVILRLAPNRTLMD